MLRVFEGPGDGAVSPGEEELRSACAWSHLERAVVAGTIVVLSANDHCTCFGIGYGIGKVRHLAGFGQIHEIGDLIHQAINRGEIETSGLLQIEEGASNNDRAEALSLLAKTVQQNRGPVEFTYERSTARFAVLTRKEPPVVDGTRLEGPAGMGGEGATLRQALSNAATHPWFLAAVEGQ